MISERERTQWFLGEKENNKFLAIAVEQNQETYWSTMSDCDTKTELVPLYSGVV